MGDLWVGRDEHEGVPSQPRKDVEAPPHWRLEAVVHTPRPRSLTISADRRSVVFIEDGGDVSDVWLLDLAGGRPQRLTTGRAPMPWWGDTAPRLSPDGSTVAYADDGHVWLVAVTGGPPRRLLEAGSPAWIDARTLVVSIERERKATRLAVVDVGDPWPRRLSTGSKDLGDEGEAAVSPDATRVAFTFFPREDLNRSEIRVADVATGATRVLTGTPRMHDVTPAWSPDGGTIAFCSERSGRWQIHLAGPEGERQLTSGDADHGQPEWHPDGTRILCVRGTGNRFGIASVDVATGSADGLAGGGRWADVHWTADGDAVGSYESSSTPPALRRAAAGAVHEPAPLAVRRAPYAELEEVSFPSSDGLEIPAFLLRPAGASAEHPVPAVVYPHGGPTDAYGDEWDGHAQYFVDKGYAWLAVNFRGSTGYGRDFERADHGVWGVMDTQDCLAAADYLRGLEFVDGDRLAIFGGSYGSYMALSAVVDDTEGRFRCAVAKYGDCDILTSWAQGDREGVQDLERMMGHPAGAREAYAAGSPLHRLAALDVPLLIAHGERDERVSPRQSEQLVAELRRLGKRFEYVTYPTEAHGFLRAGPQLHFYRRLERFLDWHLL